MVLSKLSPVQSIWDIILIPYRAQVYGIRYVLNWALKPISKDSKYHSLFLIGASALTTHLIHRAIQRIPTDGLFAGLQRQFFRIVKQLPPVKRKIKEEVGKADKSLEEDVRNLYQGNDETCICITELPAKGMSNDAILDKIKVYMDLGPYTWEDGKCSGAVYHGGEELTDLFVKTYELTVWTNPLHMNVFPGVCKMEAEIVRITANLFGGGPETCGSLTSGGTESLLLAVKVYRDWARDVKSILHPEILVPITAHAAFDKAAQFLDIRIKKVPINPVTCTVDVRKMRKMITRNTCMLVGSAPGYPHGCMDDIEEIGKLGVKYGIPVHVDACLGGFLIAFMEKAGYPLRPFDFRVPGVTSISADTHKYGNSPKGSSVLLFSDVKYKHYQYFVETNWPGGLYASPSLAGSRPGAAIAGCWASFLYFGMDGYVESTRKIMETTRTILTGTKDLPGVQVMGNPEASIVAWSSKDFDIYRLQDAMTKKGWQVNALQFPPSIHFCVAHCQTKDGIADSFVKDFTESVETIMQDPKEPARGTAAIYGTTQQIPDRSLVSEITASYLDKLYLTEFSK